MPQTHPGNLRHLIDIVRVTSVINENGYPVTRDEIVCRKLWAAASDEHDQTTRAADSIVHHDIVHFVIRHRSGIEAGMIVVFGGKRYTITSVDHSDFRRDYMTLKTKLTKAVNT